MSKKTQKRELEVVAVSKSDVTVSTFGLPGIDARITDRNNPNLAYRIHGVITSEDGSIHSHNFESMATIEENVAGVWNQFAGFKRVRVIYRG